MFFSCSQFGIKEVVRPIHPILNPLKSNILYGFDSNANPSILALITFSEIGV